jgi:hypothetical protein
MTDLSNLQIGESVTVSFCSDSLECCALRWAVQEIDRGLGRHPVPELLEMRNWLVSLYNEYQSGKRECSNCRAPPPPPRPDPSKDPSERMHF